MSKWVDENIPEVKLPDGQIAYRWTKILNNGDKLVIGKKFFSEAYSKNQYNANLKEITEALMHIEDWIDSATHNGVIEDGIDHPCNFKVYLAEYKDSVIQLKGRMTDGLIAHTMKLLKKQGP